MEAIRAGMWRRIQARYEPFPHREIPGAELLGSFDTKQARVSPLEDIAKRPVRYDAELAYTLAVISGWTYSDGQTLANKLEWYGLGGNTVYEFGVDNPGMLVSAKAFFIRSRTGRVGVLSFCGTAPDSIIDMLTDANVSLKSFGGDIGPKEATPPAVHSGFYDSVEVLWDDVSKRLELARSEERDDDESRPEALEALYLTGHSLGGAMAVVAAARILRSATWRSLLKGMYTYGQPAVGNREFVTPLAAALDGRYFRHVYASDVVPRVPPKECGSYCHFGTEMRWDGTQWIAAPSSGEKNVTNLQTRIAIVLPLVGASLLARRLPGLGTWPLPWPLSRFSYSIDDHFPIHYIDACREALPPVVQADRPAQAVNRQHRRRSSSVTVRGAAQGT